MDYAEKLRDPKWQQILEREEIHNPWIEYERMKKMIPSGLSPKDYRIAIFSICNMLSI
jgi:hypothetical protein